MLPFHSDTILAHVQEVFSGKSSVEQILEQVATAEREEKLEKADAEVQQPL